jgi:hypothetical protein
MGVLDMGGSDQDVDPGQSSVPHECYTPGVARRDSFTGIDHPASGDVLLVDLVPGAGATTPRGGRLDRLRGNRGDQDYPVPAATPLDRRSPS